ncbi:hypothetical protein RSK60_520012 [Ralstonia solanacearum K60]|nr:hypothetical protein RSK60_520012 [Ralstonia solanacearum K60]
MSELPPLVMTRLATVAPGPAPASRLMLNGVVLLQFTLIDEVDAWAPWLGSKAAKANALAELMMQMALTVVDTPNDELVDAADATTAVEHSAAARAVLSASAFISELLEKWTRCPAGHALKGRATQLETGCVRVRGGWPPLDVGCTVGTRPKDARMLPACLALSAAKHVVDARLAQGLEPVMRVDARGLREVAEPGPAGPSC